MFKFDESMYGRRVRFINAKAHEEMPGFYPEVETIGTIIPPKGTAFEKFGDDFAVQWPEGSTSLNDIWVCDEDSLELVE